MYSRALISTAPTDVTALFSSAPAFVFLLSVVILREPPLILRVSEKCLVSQDLLSSLNTWYYILLGGYENIE